MGHTNTISVIIILNNNLSTWLPTIIAVCSVGVLDESIMDESKNERKLLLEKTL